MIVLWYHILVVLSAVWMPAMKAMGDAADVPWGLQKVINDVTEAEKDVADFNKYLGQNKLQWLPDLYNRLVWQTLNKLQDNKQTLDSVGISQDARIENRDRLQKVIDDITNIKWGNYSPPGTQKGEKPGSQKEGKKEEKPGPQKEEKKDEKPGSQKEEKKEEKPGSQKEEKKEEKPGSQKEEKKEEKPGSQKEAKKEEKPEVKKEETKCCPCQP